MRFFLVLTFLGSTVVFSADTAKQIYEALEATRGKGIEAKRFFRCVDPDGKPVSGAHVSSGLYPDGSFENAIIHKRFTDTNGMFVVEGRTDGEISFTVNKEGYYETHQQIRLSRDPNVAIRNGRWQPYGITNTVIVKDVRNPIPMYVSPAGNECTFPKLDTPIGFDLEKNDWVAPYGRGEIADFEMALCFSGTRPPSVSRQGFEKEIGPSSGVPTTWSNETRLVVSFIRPFDGYYRAKKEPWSLLACSYQADTNAAFQPKIEFFWTNNNYLKRHSETLKDDEYIVFRTRSRMDGNGDLKEARYGKIIGIPNFRVWPGQKGVTWLLYYFNPNPNDTNLEFDAKKSLLESDKNRGFIRMP